MSIRRRGWRSTREWLAWMMPRYGVILSAYALDCQPWWVRHCAKVWGITGEHCDPRSRFPWTWHEDEAIRRMNKHGLSDDEIANVVCRTPKQVRDELDKPFEDRCRDVLVTIPFDFFDVEHQMPTFEGGSE